MESLTALNVVIGCVGVFALKQIVESFRSSGNLPLPPGPAPKPLIGNLLDLPPPGRHDWKHWAKHKDLYGPISSISVLGKHLIIVNDLETATELLEKRSSVTSDRPASVFGGVMCGWEKSLAMSGYGERFRRIRKDMHQVIGTSAAMRKFYRLEEIEVRRFLLKVLETPRELAEHIRRTTGAIILSISFGYAIDHDKLDPLVNLADEVLAEASIAFNPGSWIVDFIPFLQHLPDWLPGMKFKHVAKRYFVHVMELLEKPHAFVKAQMANGTAKPSYTQEMLEKGPWSSDDENLIKWAAAAIYGGGADTTVSITYSFYLAMTLYPEVQKKAQAELDYVIGAERLPTFEDRNNLPYINALVKEALRWNAVLPMGLPHVLSEDIEFRGYLIPKGGLIMPNISLFAHDQEAFHNPMEFIPERYLETEGYPPEIDSKNIVFGFGRRVCPGRELADHSLFILFAMSLAAFNITKAKDDCGNVIEAKSEWTPGLISRPMEFKCSVIPRSAKAETLIKSINHEHPAESSDAESLVSLNWDPEHRWS